MAAFKDDWLDFVTFSRGSVATYFDGSAVLRYAAINEPRFDHNPLTGEPLGILIERARTNLIEDSSNVFGADWTKLASSVLNNQIISPDGTLSGDRLFEDTTNDIHRARQTVSVSINTDYAFSIYVKPDERYAVSLSFVGVSGNCRASFNLLTGAASVSEEVGGYTITEAYMRPCANGWWRVVMSAKTDTDTSFGADIRLLDDNFEKTYLGDGASGVYVWGGQFEQSRYASSYIPTAAASTSTRSVDVIAVSSADFISDLSAANFSILIEFSSYSTDFGDYFCIHNGLLRRAGINISSIGAGGGISFTVSSNSQIGNAAVNLADITSEYTFDYVFRAAGCADYAKDLTSAKIRLAVNGVFSEDDLDLSLADFGIVPEGIDNLTLGNRTNTTARALDGHLKYLKLLPYSMNKSELIGFSKKGLRYKGGSRA